jgi:hypothetical protein
MSVHDLRPTPEVVELHDLPALALRLAQAERTIHERYVWALSAIYATVGREMAEKGQKTRTDRKAGVRYHLDEPRVKAYCACHRSLLYQCPNGPLGEGEIIQKIDARPNFYVTALKDGDD